MRFKDFISQFEDEQNGIVKTKQEKLELLEELNSEECVQIL